MRTRMLPLLGSLLLASSAAAQVPDTASTPIDLTKAAVAFAQAKAACSADDGALWGVSLCGPMLLVEPQSRFVVTNEKDDDGLLTRHDGVYTGTLPDDVTVANTATPWAGRTWAMIMWPLPADSLARQRLMMHESWHRIQDQISFPSSGAANNHLDTADGRLWLQLEWRALARALRASGPDRAGAVRDALLFRAERRTLFPKAAEEERSMEMHEGLAEYTGFALSGDPDVERSVAHQLDNFESRPSFVRSFAYASGPAYGVLLDDATPGWRKALGSDDDVGVLAAQAYDVTLPDDLGEAAEARLESYDGVALRDAENERGRKRKEQLDHFKALLVDGPVLVLPMKAAQIGFDPNTLIPLDTLGTVYQRLVLSADWGKLDVNGGAALVGASWSHAYVPAPSDTSGSSIQGDGWVLTLNDGWVVGPGERPGDLVVKEQ